MRNSVWIIPLFLLIYSCNRSENTSEKKSDITVSVDVSDVSRVNLADIFKKIDLIPMETTNESLVGNIEELIYVKDNYFIMRDGNRNVYTFDKDGTFIANSLSVRGNGPGEYTNALYAVYNPFTEAVDILQPFNKITSYDISFHFMNEKKINDEGKSYGFFHYIYPISESEYICLYPTIYEAYNTVFFYDLKSGKMVEKIVFEEIYSGLTQIVSPVRYADSSYYFTPALTTYSGYTIDINNRTMTQRVYLDFGNQKISPQKKKYDRMEEIQEYLLQSNIPVPLTNLFNNNYLICRILMPEKVEIYTLFCNLTTKQHYLINEATKDNYKIPYFYVLEDSVLYSAINPYHIHEYIDLNLLSEKSKDYMSRINEEDNPVVVKYYLH